MKKILNTTIYDDGFYEIKVKTVLEGVGILAIVYTITVLAALAL